MFNLFTTVIAAMGALQQVIVFVAALCCAAISAVILGSAVHWKVHGLRVQGRLIGVRQTGGDSFRSVYRYELPSGQSYEATSKLGSSSLRGRETGASVPLLVIPGHYTEVEEARSHVWTLVGGFLLAISVLLFYVAVHFWPVGPMTWIVAAILAAQFAVKIYRIARPSFKQPGASPEQRDMTAIPLQRSEDILAQPERRANDARQRAQQRRWAPVLLVVGLLLLALSYSSGHTLARLETSGLRAPGIVQSLERSNSGGRDFVLYPVVTFTATGGNSVRFRDASGSNPPANHIGDHVTVLYLANDSKSAMIDRGVWNWLVPLLAFMGGAFLSRVSVRMWRPVDPSG